MRSEKTPAREEVGRDARQEEGRQSEDAKAAGQEGAGGERRAGHRRRREGRLAAHLEARLRSWWERHPMMLRLETEGLRYAGFRVRQETDAERRLVLRADRGGHVYRITYPHAFPSEGSVMVTDDPRLEDEPRVRMHWGEPPMGVTAIERLVEEPPLFFSARAQTFPVLLPRSWWSIRQGASGTLTLGMASGGAFAAVDLTGSADSSVVSSDAATLRRPFSIPLEGWWYRGDEPDWSDTAETITRRIEEGVARSRNIAVERVRADLRGQVAAVAYTPRWSRGEAGWCFVMRTPSGQALIGLNELLDRGAMRLRAPHSRELRGKRVAVIGCGALGWTIAMSLARAGVSRFDLYDPDLLSAGNLPRIGAEFGLLGRLKVDALKAEIEGVALDAEVGTHSVFVGEDVGARALIDAAADLLIDASADDLAPVEVNLASVITRAPSLYAWTSGGVVGARILRVDPGRTPCYFCLQLAQLEPIAGPRQARAEWLEQFVWNGANFNLDAVAAAATRMAVRTVLGHAPTVENPDHIVLRFGGPVPESDALDIPRDPTCEVCHGR